MPNNQQFLICICCRSWFHHCSPTTANKKVKLNMKWVVSVVYLFQVLIFKTFSLFFYIFCKFFNWNLPTFPLVSFEVVARFSLLIEQLWLIGSFFLYAWLYLHSRRMILIEVLNYITLIYFISLQMDGNHSIPISITITNWIRCILSSIKLKDGNKRKTDNMWIILTL